MLQYYGPRPFKCRFPQCEFWQYGFQKRASRDKHELSHDKPLKCYVKGCEFGVIGFLSNKMRRDHFKHAHRSDPTQLSFDAQSLVKDDIGTLLSNLVQKDQVVVVRKILSAFPDALQTNETRHKLQILAAFAASGAMLELLEGSAEYSEAILMSSVWVNCIPESINGHNGSTLRYILTRVDPFSKDTSKYFPKEKLDFLISQTSQLVSNDWLEGTKIWSNWLRSAFKSVLTQGSVVTDVKQILGGKKAIQAAASHSAGDQQLLHLWKDFRDSSFFDKKWSSQTLRKVAEFSCSITLAIYLLEQGADINGRTMPTHRTPLQRAAKNTSAEGAAIIRFLLLNGADPEADQQDGSQDARKKVTGKKMREEEGAKGIHRWLGKTWDELVEETKRSRSEKDAGKVLMSKISEVEETGFSDW
jgi:hypothetical protein